LVLPISSARSAPLYRRLCDGRVELLADCDVVEGGFDVTPVEGSSRMSGIPSKYEQDNDAIEATKHCRTLGPPIGLGSS
jgi:hypothetical protein